MKIRTEPALALSACVLLTGTVGYFGYSGLNETRESLKEIGEVRVPSLVGLADIMMGQQVVRANNGLLMNAETRPANREALYAGLEKGHEQIKVGWDLYAPLPQTPEEAKAWEQLVPIFESWQKDAQALTAQLKTWQALKANNAPAEQVAQAHAQGKEMFSALGTHDNSSRKLLDEIWQINVNVSTSSLAEGYADAQASVTLLLAGVGLAIAVSFAFAT